jgi:hypothetical protein
VSPACDGGPTSGNQPSAPSAGTPTRPTADQKTKSGHCLRCLQGEEGQGKCDWSGELEKRLTRLSCDGLRPVCSPCARRSDRGVPCEYTSEVRTSHGPSKGYGMLIDDSNMASHIVKLLQSRVY